MIWPLIDLQKAVSKAMCLPHSHLYKMIWPLIDLQKACSQAILKPNILYRMVSQPQILACLVKHPFVQKGGVQRHVREC